MLPLSRTGACFGLNRPSIQRSVRQRDSSAAVCYVSYINNLVTAVRVAAKYMERKMDNIGISYTLYPTML